MECPRCKVALAATFHKRSGITFDHCRQCRGLWFDADELDRVLDVAVRDLQPPKYDEKRATARCPKCHEPMSALTYPQTKATVDMCRSCRGIWLDKGEFEEIRTVRRTLREKHLLQEYAPVPGIKGALLRYIDSALSQMSLGD